MTEPRPEPLAPRRRGTAILFAVYLALLAWIVVWKLELPWVGSGALREVKLVPFAASGDSGASVPREVIANLLLFVPFGVYLSLLARRWRWWQVAAVAAGASVVLEVAQFVFAVGSSDTTDVLVNVVGAVGGWGLVRLLRRRFGDRADVVVTRICVVATIIGALFCVAFVVSPFSYAQHER